MNQTGLDARAQELVKKHYEDALRIAQSYRTEYLPEDERETIAVKGLLKAAQKFDPEKYGLTEIVDRGRKPKAVGDKQIAFNTYLFKLIQNDLHDGVRKAKRVATHMQVKSMAEYPTHTWSIK